MKNTEKDRARLRKHKQRGSEMVEFTLTFLPFMGFMVLLLNMAWAIYTRATLQYAVERAVRYAVTSQTSGALGQVASIQGVVQANSFGRLAGCGTPPANYTNGWCNIYVNFYQVDATSGAVTDVTGQAGSNGASATGVLPLVEVSVKGQTDSLLLPFIPMPGIQLGALQPIGMNATAFDRMEAAPLCGNVNGCVPNL